MGVTLVRFILHGGYIGDLSAVAAIFGEVIVHHFSEFHFAVATSIWIDGEGGAFLRVLLGDSCCDCAWLPEGVIVCVGVAHHLVDGFVGCVSVRGEVICEGEHPGAEVCCASEVAGCVMSELMRQPFANVVENRRQGLNDQWVCIQLGEDLADLRLVGRESVGLRPRDVVQLGS